MIVQPGSAFFGPQGSSSGLSKVTKHDLDLIKGIRGVSNAGGFTLKTTKLEYNRKIKFVLGIGLPADESGKVFGSRFDISEGREFREGNKKAAIVGNLYSTDETILGKKIKIGDTIHVEGKEFRVIGIRKKLGDPENDVSIIIPIESAWELYGNTDEYSIVNAKLESGFEPSEVAARIKEKLRKDRNQEKGEEDFKVQTSEELFQSFAVILNIIQAVIVGIAAISLVVGSIGVRVVGVATGLGMGKIIEFAARSYLGSDLLTASTSLILIFGALAFSFLLGCIAGVAPARQAARLHPVQALRYE